MYSYSRQIRLPELEGIWKWPRMVSPHLPDVEQDSIEWSASFGVFTPEVHALVHERGKLNLLAGMCYARLNKEQVRSGCDIMHLFFMFDEESDKSKACEVWHQASIQMDALRNPDKPRPRGEWIGGEFTRQFWKRVPESSTDIFRKRFIQTWEDYVTAVAVQAEARDQSHIPDLETFMQVRRQTSGAYSTIALCEIDLNIPDDIRRHPTIVEMEMLAVDLICIANDLLSYNKEQAVGDDEHNIVTVIMRQFGLGVQAAIDEAGDMCAIKTARFEKLYLDLPRWVGPVDLDVQKLVDGMGLCVGGVMHWSYESQRYFGKRGLEIKESRTLNLLPKVAGVTGTIAIDDGKM